MPSDKKQQKELIYAELENLKSTNMARPIMFEDSVVYAEIKHQKVTDQQEEVKTSSVRELIKKFDTASTSQHFSSLSKKINFTNEIKSNQKEQQTYNKSVKEMHYLVLQDNPEKFGKTLLEFDQKTDDVIILGFNIYYDKDRKELRQFKEKSNENHLVAKDIQFGDKNELFAHEQTYKEIIKNIDERPLNIKAEEKKSVSDHTLTLSSSQEKKGKRFTNWIKNSRLGKMLGFNNYHGKDKKELRQLDESSNKNRLIANKVEIDDKKLFRINEQTYKKTIKNINDRPLKMK
ncbi:hypothetical protein BH747_00885 [Enterococcus villorum]|uniref:Uncharacterized protein n=1 Tax=Enterococcus villorum TaxID=112904 RepID=A0A1V8YFM3_9ENTE|nr:hypothetical protein [Enterococcus villorum]OQO71419.1 hypothetical protein BH747_00885 [Enterococcus villorum]OQO71738.1 hypothetical protein BH744_13770 [Enterococcus villorum]